MGAAFGLGMADLAAKFDLDSPWPNTSLAPAMGEIQPQMEDP